MADLLRQNRVDLGKVQEYRQRRILSSDEFCKIIMKEGARADRENTAFSVLTFKASQETPPAISERLVNMLLNRTRQIDCVGWLDDEKICVLMPSTEKEGATKLALDVVKMIDTANPEYSIFSYSTKVTAISRKNDISFNPLDVTLKPILSNNLPLWKRAMDIFGSITGLIILSPILLLISLYIKIVAPGHILFKQRRVGYNGKTFTFLKFRTMKRNNNINVHKAHATDFIHRDIPMEKLDNTGDPRIILGGRILRKTCLDELPQLVNILRGEMSLVGPRPCIPYEAEEYSRWHTRRFNIVPGLTGLWQVSGKNRLTFKQMVRMDIEYTENISFWLDCKILIKTIPAITKFVFEATKNKVSRKIEIFRHNKPI